jgi:UDP-glucose 4-epimerase
MSRGNRRVAVVLGGFGFIGRHVARALSAAGYRVVALGHGQWPREEHREWGIEEWLSADIDLESLMRLDSPGAIDCVIHCGGGASVAQSFQQPHRDYQRTVASTAATLDFIRTSAPRARLVLASSGAVYGDQGDIDLVETSATRPESPYGCHKFAAERLAEGYSRCFDLPVTVVRLFSAYGEGLRKQLLWDALIKLRSGRASFFGTGEELRDWVHVSDAANLLVRAAEARHGGYRVFNGGAHKASTRTVLEMLARTYGVSASIEFTGERHKGNPLRMVSNSSLARTELEWRPLVDLQEGLARYVDWFKRTAAAK